ncbi:MAG: hypothetical protein RL220_1979 [Bacteroidota bacterium]
MLRFPPRLWLCVLAVSVLSGSCNLIDPEEAMPSFIYIDELSLEVEPGEGTASHKITEVWIYTNGQMLGSFDLPAKVPVLNQGSTDIIMFAGIKNNGISSTRIRYPFYETFDTTLVFSQGSEHFIHPRFAYRNDISIEQYGFEAGSNPFVQTGTGDVGLNVNNDDNLVFEGGGSGYAILEDGNDQILIKTNETIEFSPGNTIFMELNYSCNNTFATGLYAVTDEVESKKLAVVINPTTSGTGNPVWNKIYIDLGLIPLQNQNADYFEIYFESVASGDQTVEFLIDNVKIVQFD